MSSCKGLMSFNWKIHKTCSLQVQSYTHDLKVLHFFGFFVRMNLHDNMTSFFFFLPPTIKHGTLNPRLCYPVPSPLPLRHWSSEDLQHLSAQSCPLHWSTEPTTLILSGLYAMWKVIKSFAVSRAWMCNKYDFYCCESTK